ncbi:hypothetical protein SUGI_0878030 [Cryptomeria japonica]|nr:hypothetical protein SUGI_0878030 [Cryptomeria japonica]
MYPFCFNMFVGSAFLLIWVIIHFPFSKACLQDERGYLLDSKADLNLSLSLSSWQRFNCCEWEGVVCDYHTSHVTHVSTHSYNWFSDDYDRTREVRPSLFNLQHLQHLDFSRNNFQGISIPPQLSKLHKLTFLILKEAGFADGEVPTELGNLSSLHHLDISNNHNSNSKKFDVWVKNLRSLEFLRMNGVNLRTVSEHWGEALSCLPNLTQIHLFQCRLSGQILDLSNLTHLSHLHIGWNSFPFKLPSWFENVSSLVSLDLSGCGLDGSIASNFMQRSRISNLVLDSNPNLKGNLSFILMHSSSLVSLFLISCNL